MVDVPEIAVSTEDGQTTITGVGELDLRVSKQFSQALSEAVASGQRIAVDFRRVIYLDSAIAAALVRPAKAMLEREERLKVLVVKGAYPEYALRTVGFADIMEIVAENGSAATGR